MSAERRAQGRCYYSQGRCYYCGLVDSRVEASGVYHCPNVLCMGPGAGYWRSKLKSYAEDGCDHRHTVDAAEAVAVAREYADNLPYRDRALAEHILASIPKWLDGPA